MTKNIICGQQFGFRKHHSTYHAINYSVNWILDGITLMFFVKLDFEIAVDQQTRAHDQTFEGVPDSACPLVPAGQPRPYLLNFCQITLTCSQPCFGVLYL